MSERRNSTPSLDLTFFHFEIQGLVNAKRGDRRSSADLSLFLAKRWLNIGKSGLYVGRVEWMFDKLLLAKNPLELLYDSKAVAHADYGVTNLQATAEQAREKTEN